MKFKHGDRVTCKIKGKEISDARISIDRCGAHFVCQNVFCGSSTEEQFGYSHAWFFSVDDPEDGWVTELKLKDRTIDSGPLEEGDILLDEHNEKRQVLGVCGKVAFVSFQNDFENVSCVCTKKHMIDIGWKLCRPISTEPEVKEVTLAEVAMALGIPVENLRIKGENK